MKVCGVRTIFVVSSTLNDMATHTFIYDDACPMCKGYTGVFRTLDWSDRRAFSTLKTDEVPALDLDRGRHEIPLINLRTGEIRYGLEAMTTVIGNALPHLKPLVRSRLLLTLFKPWYWLITYNRRIIAGTKPPPTGFDCAPDFHPGWRLAYIALLVGVVVWLGLPSLPLAMGFGLLLLAGLGLHPDRISFLGNFVTVLFLAALVLAVVPGLPGTLLAGGLAVAETWRRW